MWWRETFNSQSETRHRNLVTSDCNIVINDSNLVTSQRNLVNNDSNLVSSDRNFVTGDRNFRMSDLVTGLVVGEEGREGAGLGEEQGGLLWRPHSVKVGHGD